jgi:hypothetical protein
MTTASQGDPAAPGWSSRRNLARFGAVCGILLIVFTVVADVLYGAIPGPDSTNRDIAQYWITHADRLLAAHVFFNLASISFFFFAGLLWTLLREAEGEPSWITNVCIWGAIVAIATASVGNAYWGTAANIAHDYRDLMDPQLGVLMWHLAVVFFMAFLGFTVLQIGIALLSFQTAVFPRWFAWVGLINAVLWLIQQWPVPRNPNQLQRVVFDWSGPGAHLVQMVWLIALAIFVLARTWRGAVPAAQPARRGPAADL